jgi:molybdate transport system ATP-binding protein
MLDESHLKVRFRHQLGTLKLDVAFETGAPWTVLFGPSGSGKSTILRVIAGLETPGVGYVRVGSQTVLELESGVNVPAWRREVRWSAQRAMLYPGMTVAENLAFAANDVDGVLEGFHLTALAKKRPQELSGGEAQRVAVARAAAGARGKVLLLDEPFAGLDGGVRDELILDLREWLGETPVISVTHDVGEAFLLGAEVVRVAEGEVVAQGAVGDVLGEERRRLVGVLG